MMTSRFRGNLSSPFIFWGRNLLFVLVATGGTILVVGGIATSQRSPNQSSPTEPQPTQPSPSSSTLSSPSEPSPPPSQPDNPAQKQGLSDRILGLLFPRDRTPPEDRRTPRNPSRRISENRTPPNAQQAKNVKQNTASSRHRNPAQPRRSRRNPFAAFLAQTKPTERPTSDRSTSPSSSENGIPLTLEDAVNLTVANNTPIQNAYLDRIVQRASLRTAQGEFNPKLTPTVRSQLTGDGENLDIEETQEQIELGAGISLLLPTGGEIQVDWRSQLRSLNALTSDESVRQRVNFSFNQPLLRDAGAEITRLNLNRALVQEDINLLALRDTLSVEVIQSIKSYRQLLQQQEQVENTQVALKNAKQRLERQRALVEAGRAAQVSLLRSEQNVTDFESQLLEARNAVKSARLALLNQLGIERDLPVVAVENVAKITQTPAEITEAEVATQAFNNRPDYLTRLLNFKLAEFNVVEAENNRQWRLDLQTEYNQAFTDQSDVSAQLVFTRPLGNRRQEEEAFERARVNVLKQENNLDLRREQIRTEISDRIREIQLRFRQIELAQEAVELAQRELEAQEALLDAGEGDTFELQQAQQTLLNAKNAALQRRIEYLNSLTDLQRTQGTTLEFWNIRLERDS
ncbi:MAG: TolC family protein [Kamptonema sp. SIO4C4]|nr:TolC family protein [Kamptonema sp. SIO4C4]